MSPDRTVAIGRHTTRLLLADPVPIVVTTLMPVLLMAFLQGMGQAVLAGEGFPEANGAEQVVPGMAVLFGLFGVMYVGMAFFAEHGWGTWERLRASHATAPEILFGKLVPPALVMLLQTVVLFGAGWLLFGLRIRGSLVALVAMMLATTVFLVAVSMACVAILRTVNQLSAAVNVGAMVLGGLGGALAPVSVLPAWARAVAPLSPAYWSLEGFRAVTLAPGGLDAVLVPVAVLLGSSVVIAAVAARRFRFTDEKAWS